MVERIDWTRKDIGREPNLGIRGEVLNAIQSRREELGWVKEGEKIDPQNIFFPSVNFIGDERGGVLRGMDQQDLLSVIFVAGKEHAVVKNEINFSEERGLFSGIPELRIGLGELLPASDKRIGMAIYFSCRKKISIPNMVSLDRLGPKPGISDVGFISPTEKQVLLIAGSDDGIPNVATVVLPADFANAFENGRLVGESEGKQKEPELGEHPETPELELKYEVIRRISKHLYGLGLICELDPKDISAPPVSAVSSDFPESEARTKDALNTAELSSGFAVICVGGEKEQHISVAGSSSVYRIGFVLGFKTGGGISSFSYSHGRNPSIFVGRENNTEFRLGRDWSSQDEYVLLAFIKNGRREVSSLALPPDWKSVFDNDGRLLKKPAEPTKNVSPSAVVLLEAQRPAEQFPQVTFSQMVEKVKSFPFYRGPAENKIGVRTASFGKEQTPVEIGILDDGNRLVFKFYGLNAGELEKVFKSNRQVLNLLTLEAFTSCFKPGFDSRDILAFDVTLDTSGQLGVKAGLLRWDINKGCEVDSSHYLCFNLNQDELGEIQKIIGGKALPHFFSQLNLVKNRSSGITAFSEEAWLRPEDRQARRRLAQKMSGGSGKKDADSSRQINRVVGLLQNETIFPGNIRPSYTGKPSPSFKDRSPEDRKNESGKYWTMKKGKESKKSGKSKKRK